MVQLSRLTDFNRQVIQYDGVTVPMKESIGLLGKTDLTSREMCEVVMQTSEPVSTREATERLVRILVNNYEKAYFEQVSTNATQLNS